MAISLANCNLTAHVSSIRHHHNRPSPLSYKPKTVTATVCMSHDASYYWTSIHQDIESFLNKNVVVKDPIQVYEPMRHLVFSAPVSAAPALCVAACELVGGRREQALAAADGLHVVHAGQSVHGNLPLSCRPSLIPKPWPVRYHAYRPGVELLVVDGMIPFGLQLLADSADPDEKESGRILRALVEMTRAIGSQGVIGRQYRELPTGMCEEKGSVLHACGAACGGILGGGSDEEVEVLRRFGYQMGLIEEETKMMSSNNNKNNNNNNNNNNRVKGIKELAIKELKSFFYGENVELISSFVEVNFSHV